MLYAGDQQFDDDARDTYRRDFMVSVDYDTRPTPFTPSARADRPQRRFNPYTGVEMAQIIASGQSMRRRSVPMTHMSRSSTPPPYIVGAPTDVIGVVGGASGVGQRAGASRLRPRSAGVRTHERGLADRSARSRNRPVYRLRSVVLAGDAGEASACASLTAPTPRRATACRGGIAAGKSARCRDRHPTTP